MKEIAQTMSTGFWITVFLFGIVSILHSIYVAYLHYTRKRRYQQNPEYVVVTTIATAFFLTFSFMYVVGYMFEYIAL